jgi:beta-glucosidase
MTSTPYLDPSLPIEQRLDDLLARMTLAEKAGQLCQLDGRCEPLQEVAEKQPGSFLQVLGEDLNRIIDANQQTRLAIPILFGVDAIHGHSFWPGATIFPTQLGLAGSWNRELVQQMGRITAVEMGACGVPWTFSPVCCIARDLRWGRVDETFGEDPWLIGELASALIRGYQGDDLSHPDAVAACTKHYAGYSETLGGRDASEAQLSRRQLRSFFLPPFEAAAKAGSATFMIGYQAIDGVPSTCNRWLLREVLKDEWAWNGTLVTDWNNVGHLVENQRVCADYAEAATKAIQAGNDLMMNTPKAWQGIIDAVERDQLDVKLVDDAVRRVLRLKFKLGLFENPRRASSADPRIGSSEHRAVALQAARESLVLLRNQGRLLPLDATNTGRLAVIGPNADHPGAQLGDWSLGSGQAGNQAGHPRASVITVLDGLRQVFDDVVYAQGSDNCYDNDSHLRQPAVALARSAEIAVLVLGDDIPLTGEGRSSATLELCGGQVALAEAVIATGTPVILVLINSKPLVLPPALRDVAAIIEGFNPGMLGGQAIAELIAGRIEAMGRLPISIPKHVGQQPIYYNQVRGQHGTRYVDMDQQPLYAFGEGLNYSECHYDNPSVVNPAPNWNDDIQVQVQIRNVGQRPMRELVQCYLRDEVTSATWVDRTLVAYQHVDLAPGETKTVELSIPFTALALVDEHAQRVVEPGDFTVLVGKSSRPEHLQAARFQLQR